MAFEVFEVAIVEGCFVGGGEHHRRGDAGLQGFLPTWGAEAPAIPGFEAREAKERVWGRQIIAGGFGKREKVIGGFDTHGMDANIFDVDLAIACPIKSGDWVHAAGD